MIIPARLNRFYVESEIVPVTRLWDAEIPVGDPFGGAAFGEKNKKLVKSVVKVVKKVAPIALGIAAAFATGGAAFAAFNALGTVTGSVALALSTGVAFAGSVLSVVGTATGNEKLTKIGSVLGLAGGAGMVGTNIAAAAQGGAGFSDAVVKGLQDTVQQLKDGSKTSWEKLTGTPTAGFQAPAEQLPPTAGEAVAGLDGVAGDIGANLGEAASTGLDGVSGDLSPAYAGGNSAPTQGLVSQAMNASNVAQAPQSNGLISSVWNGAKEVGKFVADKENAGLVSLGGNILTNIVPSEKDQAEQALYEARARQIEEELGDRQRFNASIQRQSTMRVNPNARVFNPGAAYAPGQTTAYQRGLQK